MRRLNFLILCMLCLFIIVFTVSAEADDTFSAYGRVIDANNNYVSGATVTMENFAYKMVATTTTDVNGNFAFTGVSTEHRVVKVLISYTDKNGNTYSIPPEFSLWYSANGTIFINEDSTRLTDYPPSSVSARIGKLTITPVSFPSTKPSLPISQNVNALAIALALGIILIVGTFWILRKSL